MDLDGELSEGAGGEVGEPLRDVLEVVGPHDRDADDAGGSRVGELREGGRDGARHDRCEGDVVAAELLGRQAEGRGDPAAGGEEGCERGVSRVATRCSGGPAWITVVRSSTVRAAAKAHFQEMRFKLVPDKEWDVFVATLRHQALFRWLTCRLLLR